MRIIRNVGAQIGNRRLRLATLIPVTSELDSMALRAPTDSVAVGKDSRTRVPSAPARLGCLQPSSNRSMAARAAVGTPCGIRCPRVQWADAPRAMSNRHPERDAVSARRQRTGRRQGAELHRCPATGQFSGPACLVADHLSAKGGLSHWLDGEVAEESDSLVELTGAGAPAPLPPAAFLQTLSRARSSHRAAYASPVTDCRVYYQIAGGSARAAGLGTRPALWSGIFCVQARGAEDAQTLAWSVWSASSLGG